MPGLTLAAPPTPPCGGTHIPLSNTRKTRAPASSSPVSPIRSVWASHNRRPARTPCVSPTTRKPSTTSETSISRRVKPGSWPSGLRCITTTSPAGRRGAEPQCFQHYRPVAGAAGPQDCDLDIVQSWRPRGAGGRRQRLVGRDRLHPELPAVAAPIVIRKFALDQGCIPTNGSEMRLRPLDSFLESSRGVDG